MAFNPEIHQIKLIIIKCGKELRKAKGLPEEKNITILFNETAPLLGIAPIILSSRDVDHLPAPHEIVHKETGRPVIPRRDCPNCGAKETVNLHSICTGCKDSEGGKYKTMWMCAKCQFKDKSEKYLIQWLDDLKVDFGSINKESLGIRTVTDDGLK